MGSATGGPVRSSDKLPFSFAVADTLVNGCVRLFGISCCVTRWLGGVIHASVAALGESCYSSATYPLSGSNSWVLQRRFCVRSLPRLPVSAMPNEAFNDAASRRAR